MNRSTNYNFYLPENSDYRDVSAFNYNFTTIDTNLAGVAGRKSLMRINKTYTNVTIPASGYVSFDTLTNIINEHPNELSVRWFIVSMTMRGWSGATLPLQLLKNSDGTSFYVAGAPQTITSFTVEYFFGNPDRVTQPV